MKTYVSQFVEALARAFPAVPQFRNMLGNHLDWQLDRIEPGGTLDDKISAVVHWAIARGCERELLTAARAANPGSRELQALEPLLPPNVPMVIVDDFEVCYFQDRAFIDRRELRKAVKRLAAPDGPRLLVIDGPRASGKSYSLYYIHHVAQRRGFEVVEIDLVNAYPGQRITAGMVASDIASQMNLPNPPQPNEEQAPRRNKVFCNWLTGQLRAFRCTWWIVVDGWSDALAPEVLDLFNELAVHIDRPWNNIRFVLVSDVADIPQMTDCVTLRESIPLIDHTDVAEFVVRFREQLGRSGDDAEAARIVGEIMRRVDPDSPERLRMLARAAAEQCRLLLEA